MGHVIAKQAQVHIKCLTHEGDGSSGAQAGTPCNLTPTTVADSLVGEINDTVMPCAKRQTSCHI